jgi:hypothetical protein
MYEGIFVICAWFHKFPKEVEELTLVQFNELIHALGRKINWEVQVAAIPGGNKLTNKYHPLVSEVADEPEIKNQKRMSDAEFNSRMNKLFHGR